MALMYHHQSKKNVQFILPSKNDTPYGKHEFHGTVQIVYQNSNNPLESKSLKIERKPNKTTEEIPIPCKRDYTETSTS